MSSVVYYAERDGLIKIGVSRAPSTRVAAFGAVLLATEPGGYREEQARHQQFADGRLEGEWFEATYELRLLVTFLQCGRRVPFPHQDPAGKAFTTRQRWGWAIAQQRRRVGLTQKELASRVGVSVPAVSFWETGRQVPRDNLKVKIADVLRTTPSKLFSWEAAA